MRHEKKWANDGTFLWSPKAACPAPSPPRELSKADDPGCASASGKPCDTQTLLLIFQGENSGPVWSLRTFVAQTSYNSSTVGNSNPNPWCEAFFFTNMKMIILGNQRILEISVDCQNIFFLAAGFFPQPKQFYKNFYSVFKRYISFPQRELIIGKDWKRQFPQMKLKHTPTEKLILF